ncbi:hypothetical protein RCG39_04790 [Lactococcus petauri]|uniref:hypothetical protein n=1 Tax=Lactococcus petauri TaxID=1940789 RepID=UPI0027F53DB7|nr:hypothetical protein [Lactococcus petauri]MDQ7119798.1 hypothetical protein [Lactococcus petauri]MDQ7125341.1 hypothetical protein [Lactococcus petauri]MDQ7126320.1 hypothetical protein [Lactococcus petauri]MDQ7128227.1 hypothetical protein [Lactococcus petauri]MDQ7138061.1 hypothetical protein [Lactococcus petauri]
MTQYSFPWNDVHGDRLYDADDFMRFFAAFLKTGVVMSFKDGLRVRSTHNGMNIQVGSGSAVIDGGSYLNDEAIGIQVNVASSIQDRVDSVVLRMDKNARTTQLFYKPGDTTVARNDTTYELQLAKISVKTNATQITDADITDMRSDSAVCGWSTPFDNINVDGIIDQYKEIFSQADTEFQEQLQVWFATAKEKLEVSLNGMENFMNKSEEDLQNWVVSVKKIIESVDPGGKLLSQFNTLKQSAEKYIPTGFTFIIEHDSEYQPDVKVTYYKNSIGTEANGFDTGPVFGGERIYNLASSLSYIRNKVNVELPSVYAMTGEVVNNGNELLLINGTEVMRFVIEGAIITKGYVKKVKPPTNLIVSDITSSSAKISWENGGQYGR